MALKIGDIAPEFELVDTELKVRKTDEFKGKKIMLVFFVAAHSPVCKNEICTFQQSLQYISNLNVQILGISNDGPFANKAFADKYNIEFPILGDYNSKTINEYGVLMRDLLHIKDYNAAKRSIFIIDEKGLITYIWITDDPLVEPNYNEIKKFLENK